MGERRGVFLEEREVLLFCGSAENEARDVAEGGLEGVAEGGGEVGVGAAAGGAGGGGGGGGGGLGEVVECSADVGVGGLEEESGAGAGEEDSFLEDLREDFEFVEGFEVVVGEGGFGGDGGDLVGGGFFVHFVVKLEGGLFGYSKCLGNGGWLNGEQLLRGCFGE